MATGDRKRLTQLEAITIPVSGNLRQQVRTWERRGAERGMERREALRFAKWADTVSDAWETQARPLGWEPSERPVHTPKRCWDLNGLVTHLKAADGQTMHLVLEPRGRSLVAVARRCFRGPPDSTFEHAWTSADRLSVEEIHAGAPCRACGRGFYGGPEPVPLFQRTPEQQAAHDEEASEFERLHPECGAGRWTISGGGIQHCMRCCAPPPPPPDAVALLGRLLANTMRDDDDLEQRWKKPAPGASPASDSSITQDLKIVDDLRPIDLSSEE